MIKNALRLFVASIAFFVTIPSTAYASTATTAILQYGDSDSLVLQLQQVLKQQGYYNSDLTGCYDTQTKEAVIAFQKDKGLIADGQAGPKTCQYLFGNSYATLSAEQGDSVSISSNGSLQIGDQSDSVVLLQERLKALEYYDYENITGFFGPVTEEAVKRFQKQSELPVNGIADTKTLVALFADNAAYYIMSSGDSGKSILQLQDRLRELQYFSGDPTGYYGTITVSAVENFQKQNGLLSDGKAGHDTRELLFSESAAAYTSGENTQTKQTEATSSSLPNSDIVDNAVELAYSMLGREYVYGACGPNSFDCSGFIYYILKNAGLAVNKMSPSAFSTVGDWQKISDIKDLEIGDLVFFKAEQESDGAINHMGIYIGGGCFIHTSSSIGCVTRSTMASGYYNDNFVFAKRIA